MNRRRKAESSIGATMATEAKALVSVERMVKMGLPAKIIPAFEGSA